MARLWKRYGGEPFMVNPRLGLIGAMFNPRKERKKMARHRSASGRFTKRSHRRRYRRNPFPVGGLVVNPRRRRYRRNPVIAGISVPKLQPVLYAGAGFAGCTALESVLTGGDTPLIPATITGTTMGKYAVKVGCAIAVTYLGKMALGRGNAVWIGVGAGTKVLIDGVREFMPGTIPGLSAYAPLAGMRAYRPLAAGEGRVVSIGARPAALAAYNTPERYQRGY